MPNTLPPMAPNSDKRGPVRLLGSVLFMTLLTACPIAHPLMTTVATSSPANVTASATSTPQAAASADLVASAAGAAGTGTAGTGATAASTPAPSSSPSASPATAPSPTASFSPAAVASARTGGSGGYGPPYQAPQPAFTVQLQALNQPIKLIFNTAMLPASLTTVGVGGALPTFTVTKPGVGVGAPPIGVPGTLAYDGPSKTATFTPTTPPLDPNTTYTATLTTGAQNASGAALASNVVFTFNTGGQAATTSQLLAYSILSGGHITDIGASATTAGGDVGETGAEAATALLVQPIVFIVPGAYTSSVQATSAEADLTTLYNNMAGLPWNGSVIAPAPGNTTVVPGVYRDSALTTIAGSTYTMDATTSSDPANAIFVIQITGGLTTGGGSSNILLAGGAQAKNIYWQVGGAVTLGSPSTMRGNLLSNGFISFGDGVTLHGRALSRSGDVTISADTVELP